MDFYTNWAFQYRLYLRSDFCFWYRKKKDDPDIFFLRVLLDDCRFIGLFVHFGITYWQFFILAPLSLAGLFLYSYFKNKHCLVNGLLF